MRVGVAIGIGVVGLLGGIGAAIAVSMATAPSGQAPSAEVEAPEGADSQRPAIGVGIPEAQRLPVVRPVAAAPQDREPALDPRNAPEGQHVRPQLDPVFSTPVNSLADLTGRYDVGLAATIDLSDLPADATEQQVERALEDRMLAATATVNAAVESHLGFADTASRPDATAARGKAAELYVHLANTLEDAPVPGHLSEAQRTLHRQTMDRMADQNRRRASALRAGK